MEAHRASTLLLDPMDALERDQWAEQRVPYIEHDHQPGPAVGDDTVVVVVQQRGDRDGGRLGQEDGPHRPRLYVDVFCPVDVRVGGGDLRGELAEQVHQGNKLLGYLGLGVCGKWRVHDDSVAV